MGWPFRLSMDADVNGTSLQGHVACIPARVVEVFGPGSDSDGYKVSREWSFEGADGDVYTLYEYKATSLYAPGQPTPERFWRSRQPTRLNVGSRSEDVAEFITWLEQQLSR